MLVLTIHQRWHNASFFPSMSLHNRCRPFNQLQSEPISPFSYAFLNQVPLSNPLGFCLSWLGFHLFFRSLTLPSKESIDNGGIQSLDPWHHEDMKQTLYPLHHNAPLVLCKVKLRQYTGQNISCFSTSRSTIQQLTHSSFSLLFR